MEKIKNFYTEHKLPILQNVVIFGILWAAFSPFIFNGHYILPIAGISAICGLFMALFGFILSLKD